MEYRRLGKSGLKVSALSYGSWVTFGTQVDTKGAVKLMSQAFEAGINFFDNAETYAGGRSEEIMGEALKQLNWTRDSYIVSSKVFWGGDRPTQRGLSRKHVVDACNNALKRLKTDYLDLYFCHRPDLDTPVEETVLTMNDLIRQGKILYWGTSEWEGSQLMAAYAVAKENNLIPPTMEQPQYNLFEREKVERDYMICYETFGLGTTIWSPLASGILTGKYDQGIPNDSRLSLSSMGWLRDRLTGEEGRQNLEKSKALGALAKELGISRAEFAIAWCLKNPFVSSVILGASKPEQLTQNLQALGAVEKLDDSVMAHIETIVQNQPEDRPRY